MVDRKTGSGDMEASVGVYIRRRTTGERRLLMLWGGCEYTNGREVVEIGIGTMGEIRRRS